MEFAHIPILSGATAIIGSDNDSRKYLMYAITGMLLIVLVLESMGFTIGTLGGMVTTAFPLLLGYVFGQKEAEARKPNA